MPGSRDFGPRPKTMADAERLDRQIAIDRARVIGSILTFKNGHESGYAARGRLGWWACGCRGNAYVFPNPESARCRIAEVAAEVLGVPPNTWTIESITAGDTAIGGDR